MRDALGFHVMCSFNDPILSISSQPHSTYTFTLDSSIIPFKSVHSKRGITGAWACHLRVPVKGLYISGLISQNAWQVELKPQLSQRLLGDSGEKKGPAL
ncbi:hypothetical protein YC2023_030642 [Brassica napus]